MSDVAAPLPLSLPRRATAFAAAATLALAAGSLAARLSPSPLPALGLALIVAAAALGLAALAEANETALWTKIFAAATAACALAAAAPEATRLSVALLSLALLAGGTWKTLARRQAHGAALGAGRCARRRARRVQRLLCDRVAGSADCRFHVLPRRVGGGRHADAGGQVAAARARPRRLGPEGLLLGAGVAARLCAGGVRAAQPGRLPGRDHGFLRRAGAPRARLGRA